jgi:Sec-independent protein secretion pathway components
VLGLTFDKILVIAVIAVFLLGPERLPTYAAKLGQLVRNLRSMANSAQDRMREELGPDFDVDWKKLDPRQYDPRRIIREALLEDDPEPTTVREPEPEATTVAIEGAAIAGAAMAGAAKRDEDSEDGESERVVVPAGDAPPFDTEAT